MKLLRIIARLRSSLLWIGLATGLAACGGTSNIEPPTPLTPVNKQLSVNQLWSRSTGAGAGQYYLSLSPLVLADRVFSAGSEGGVSSWSLDTGNSVWNVETQLDITAGVNGGSGTVVVGSEGGDVLALSESSGEEVWRKRLSSRVTAVSAIAENTLVVRTGDGYIYGLAANSGDIRWKILRKTPTLSLHTQSEPLVSRGVAFVGLDNGQLLMIAMREGRVLWEKTIAAGRGRTEIDRMVDIDGQMVLDGNVIYVSSFQGSASAIDAARGQLLWQEDMSSVQGVATDNRSVYITDENSVVWARDKFSGATLWKQEKLKFRRLTAPAVFANHVVVADFEGYLHWLDPESGQLVDRREADSKGVITPPVKVDDKLLVFGKSGHLSVWTQ